ncbi:hypothetical protein ACFL2K_01515 [Candidatus Margulisiibacteriota bacterium]
MKKIIANNQKIDFKKLDPKEKMQLATATLDKSIEHTKELLQKVKETKKTKISKADKTKEYFAIFSKLAKPIKKLDKENKIWPKVRKSLVKISKKTISEAELDELTEAKGLEHAQQSEKLKNKITPKFLNAWLKSSLKNLKAQKRLFAFLAKFQPKVKAPK